MVRFNSSKKPGKPKKTIRKLAQPASVKPNKPKMVFEKCFLRGRYLIATSFIFLGLGALVARAAYVQSVNSEILSGEADKRSLRKDDVLSVRGSILDRNGQLLSVSVPMSAIVAEPRLMLKENALDDKERIKALANELNMTPAELVKKIEKNAKSGFLYLARQVEASKANYIRDLKIKGISLETEPRRFYPRVEEAAQLIGFTLNLKLCSFMPDRQLIRQPSRELCLFTRQLPMCLTILRREKIFLPYVSRAISTLGLPIRPCLLLRNGLRLWRVESEL